MQTELQVKVNWEHKYKCVKKLFDSKREEVKRLRVFRDDLLSKNVRLEKEIAKLRNGNPEQREKKPSKPTYCGSCPSELTRNDIVMNRCSRCGTIQD